MKKEEFDWRGGNTRTIQFSQGHGDAPIIKPAGKSLHVTIGPGLPCTTSKRSRLISGVCV